MENQEKEKVLRIIEKLFRKTEENGCTAEEAASAAAHAQRLLARYDLTAEEAMAFEQVKGSEPDEVVRDYVKYSVKPWAWTLQALIAENFRCKSLMCGRGQRMFPVFLGHKKDAAVAKKVFEELYVIGEVLTGNEYRRYVKERHGKSEGWATFRKSWQEGFCKGLKKELDSQVSRLALVVRPPEDVLDWCKSIPYGKAPEQRGGFDYEAYSRGIYDGESVMKQKRVAEAE